MRKKLVIAGIAAISAVAIAITGTAMATPAGTVDYVTLNDVTVQSEGRDIQAPTSAQSVLFGAKLVANTSRTYDVLKFEAHTASTQIDFGRVTGYTLGTSQQTFTGSKVFPAGTYTIKISALVGTTWSQLGPIMNMTVTQAGGGPIIAQAYITGYSWFDNTPPGSADISNPILHQTAGGVGTYADPITVAVGHSIINGNDILDWPAGARFYIPNLRRYFIVEDTCGDGGTPQNGPCHIGYPAPATTWLDVWVGGNGGTAAGADACMNAITDVWNVVQTPATNYVVVSGDVYKPTGCTQQYGNALVTQ